MKTIFNQLARLSLLFLMGAECQSSLAQKLMFEREYSNLVTCPAILRGNVVKTDDRGYLNVSNSYRIFSDSSQINVVKTDVYGQPEWTTVLNIGPHFGNVHAMQLPDKGYLISATWDSIGYSDALLIKLDKQGKYQWTKRYGTSASSETPNTVFQLGPDVVLAGATFTKIFLCFLNTSGNLLSSVVYKSRCLTLEYAIATPGNEIILAGQELGSDNLFRSFFMKVDSKGAVLWANVMPFKNDFNTLFIDVAANGDLLFTGRTSDAGAGLWDIFLMRVSSSGKFKFCKTYGGSDFDEGISVHETSNGNILMFAEPESFSYANQTASILTDSLGNFLSMNLYGTSSSFPFGSVRNKEDSTFTVFATKGHYSAESAPLLMVRADENGNFPCEQTPVIPDIASITGWDSIYISTEGYLLSSDTSVNFFYGSESILHTCGNATPPIELPEGISGFNVFTPNNDGINDEFIIKSEGLNELVFDVYNRWGTKLFTGGIDQGWKGTTDAGLTCPDGVYYYVAVGRNSKGYQYSLTGFLHLMR